MRAYLRQISAYALLTAQQERELAWRYINDDDQTARDALLNANLRLVVAISRKYQHRGLSLGDLIAEGNVGLIRAAEGFDPAHGVRFSTYATLPIKQAIRRALFAASQTCTVPAYMAEQIGKWQVAVRNLESASRRVPSSQEVADEMGVPLRSLDSIRRAHKSRTSCRVSCANVNSERLDPIELLEDTRSQIPGEPGSQREFVERVMRLLNSINDRNARILRMRLGLEGQPPLALCQISEELGITRERVRQIEMQGRRRLHELLSKEARAHAEHLAA
jgi:RNA polymerase primary sigma factor